MSFAEQIAARAAALGAARGMAEADLDAKARAAAPGSKEQQRALTQSRNVERELLHMQGDDNEAEREAKQADWQQAFEAIQSEALAKAGSYEDMTDIRAEFSRLKHAHDEQPDDDKGRFRAREPDRGRTR